MKEKLERLEKEKEREGKRQIALDTLASSSLPKTLRERWLARIDLDKEDLKAQISALEGEFSDIQKQLCPAGAPLPLGSGLSKGDKPAKEEIEKIIGRL